MRGRRWPTWHASTSGTVCAPAGRAATAFHVAGKQVVRGAPGAAAVLLRAAADGGALSHAALLAGGDRRRTPRAGVDAARRRRRAPESGALPAGGP